MSIKVLIIGTGAVGSVYGAKLSQAGAKVSVLCRSDYETVNKNGIQVQSILGDHYFRPEHTLKAGQTYPQKADLVLVTTKVLPEINIPHLIAPYIHPQTTILLLQNGIFIEPPIQAAFPNNEILSGLSFICATRTAYGQVQHIDYGRLAIGKYPNGSSTIATALAELFDAVQIPTKRSDTIQKERWKKLVWNAPFNPLSVISGGMDTQSLLKEPQYRKQIHTIMTEVCACAAADNHPLHESIIEKNIQDTEKMTPYKTSMLIDFESGRPLETEAIIGNVVRFAESQNVQVPEIKAMYKKLLTLSDR